MSKNSLRIIHLTSEYPPVIGGVATHVHQLATAMANNGHDVSVVTSSSIDEEIYFNPPVYRPSVPHSRLFYTSVLRRKLRQYLQENAADIIHVHGMRPLEASKDLGIPVVFTNHTSGFLQRLEKGGKRRLRNLAWRMSHIPLVLAPSDELIEATLKTGYQGATEFISNGVDADLFYADEKEREKQRSTWGIKENDLVVLLARRLAAKNGVVDFAKACSHLTSDNIRIVIAGDGDERSAMEEQFTKQAHSSPPLFLGAVVNTDMPNIYRAADICVLPSHYEATSITGLEAMSTSLPLVGTEVGGIPTLVADNESGLLVPPHQPETMGKVIAELAADREKISRMGQAARQRVEQQFTWRAIAEKTVDAYRTHALEK